MASAPVCVPVPPPQPRPQAPARRLSGAGRTSAGGNTPRQAGAAHISPKRTPSAIREASWQRRARDASPASSLSAKILTPRSLPPLASKVSDANNNSRCSTAASSTATFAGAEAFGDGCLRASEASGHRLADEAAGPLKAAPVERGSAKAAPRKKERGEAAEVQSDASRVLTRRKQVTSGGRSFFSWSFRKSTLASQKYEIRDDE
mmetsp:Transcript_127773/g.238846  ORF Transcript_127773/g.238846 Transcript_127773/m.238846 type:complete len:205 (-) Transcript_127773:156-770(-)